MRLYGAKERKRHREVHYVSGCDEKIASTLQLRKLSTAGVSGGNYMIYLPDNGVKEDCINSRECIEKCNRFPKTWQVHVQESRIG